MKSITLATLILAAVGFAADTNAPQVDTAAAFAKLKTLAGVWEGNVGGAKARLTYELTGAGTTLVEREQADNMPGMMTMFHLDGRRLVLTHYCMVGNQPRMQARSYDAATGELRFEFVDGSNMKPGDGHMHNATLRIEGDRLITKWEFFENGKLKQTEAAEYTRVK